MAKKLKLFNGRGQEQGEHLNIAAHSRADACRMLVKLYPYTAEGHWTREMKDYFSPCWGISMDGIEPRRGIWIEKNKFKRDSTVVHVYDGEDDE